jgi:hypothetical protein
MPVNHVAPSASSTTNHTAESNVARPAPIAHAPANGSERVTPIQKVTAEDKIVPAARIGENPPEKERVVKPVEPNLRRPICEGAACKESKVKPVPESDLRRPACLNGKCGCPAGQTASKDGCVSTVAPVTPVTHQCQPGESWNGGACVPFNQCLAGQYWNGAVCIAAQANCETFIGRGAMLANELRGLKAQIQVACSQNPPAQDCEDLKMRQIGAVQRYQMLLSEAGPTCHSALPDPLSLQ